MAKKEMPGCDYFISSPDVSYAENAKTPMFRWLHDSYGYDIRENHMDCGESIFYNEDVYQTIVNFLNKNK